VDDVERVQQPERNARNHQSASKQHENAGFGIGFFFDVLVIDFLLVLGHLFRSLLRAPRAQYGIGPATDLITIRQCSGD
jgi:hypothetical protein